VVQDMPTLPEHMSLLPFYGIRRMAALLFLQTFILIFICIEDPKGVIRIRKTKERQHNVQAKIDKQRSTKHYTESRRSSNTNPT
jgi:hypothetical protein